MRHTYHRAARLAVRYQRDDLIAAIEYVLPRLSRHAESLGLYVLVCAFWGLVVYTATALWPLP